MIAQVRKKFSGAVCMALTATATERVRADIRYNLNLTESSDFIAGFNRKNLFYRIIPKDKPLQQTLDFLERHKGESGIIYTFSRDSVDRIYATLNKHGYAAKPYHAGLPDIERRRNQELFVKDEVQIIVATIAFGMGIHKTNVRFVVHFDLPKSIESYYQETGRAGRDGIKSECLLLYSHSDIHKIRYFIDQKSGEAEKRAAVMQLNALIAYADSKSCRRIHLINYFGEKYNTENCGMCDNCVLPLEHNEDVTKEAQMFLSCIKRTGEKFGTSHIINILRGSRSKKISDYGHNLLSTYGIGKDYTKNTWQNLSMQFIQKGLVFQDIEDHGGLKITIKGFSVLRGDEAFYGTIGMKKIILSNTGEQQDYHSALFDLLKEKRKELAAVKNVPAYIIFSDKTLMEISNTYPQTIESLSQIHGIGTHKLLEYGEIILGIVLKYCSENDIDERHVHVPVRREYLKVPRYIQIGELYSSGCSIQEIEESEGIKRSTVIANLNRYIQHGYTIKSAGLTSLLPAQSEQLENIVLAFKDIGPEYLKPVYDELGGSVDYNTLEVCRLYYLCKD